MSELRQEVLQAEVAIRRLAEELARTKGIADNVEEVRRRLNEAANFMNLNVALLEQSRKAMEEAMEEGQKSLKKAIEAIHYTREQLSLAIQDLSSRVIQALKDFGERVRQTLQQAYQSMQAQSTVAIGEAQKALSDAANSLTDLRTNFENQMNALMRQNEQLLQFITAQDAEIKRLSKLLALSLAFSVATTIGIIVILALLFVRA